ncbi:MAG: potassium transporter [Erysipelothrix sp.]|nr:potassium transporter [Erysipelothrix sp.]
MINTIFRILISMGAAYLLGKLLSKIKLPAILGWLIAGMILGPYALNVMNDVTLNAQWYKVTIKALETVVGLIIGSELILKELKKSGKQIIITTLAQSFAAFAVVSISFGIIFHFMNIPLYLALIFGGIALATAPAPALSIIQEFNTEGPVTKTLVPVAVIDDVIAILVFFSIITIVTATHSDQSSSLLLSLLQLIGLPILIGIVTGFVAGKVLKEEKSQSETRILTVVLILLAAAVGFFFDFVILDAPVVNFMLVGMAFSATFANMITTERLAQVMKAIMPVLGIAFIAVILNLGIPLNYNLITSAGIFTLIYIVARALGKYGGAYFGAKVSGLPDTVKKYLGFTLLPHSGVSLVFTGIAATNLYLFDPKSAALIQGTIAAAAVINEIIAVIIAKKAFEWAGEINKGA